jgi:hypothetical protein
MKNTTLPYRWRLRAEEVEIPTNTATYYLRTVSLLQQRRWTPNGLSVCWGLLAVQASKDGAIQSSTQPRATTSARFLRSRSLCHARVVVSKMQALGKQTARELTRKNTRQALSRNQSSLGKTRCSDAGFSNSWLASLPLSQLGDTMRGGAEMVLSPIGALQG